VIAKAVGVKLFAYDLGAKDLLEKEVLNGTFLKKSLS
jgi:hypothetical protein